MSPLASGGGLAALPAVAALVLAGVWLVAAATKLVAPARTARGLADLGLPAPRALTWLVAVAELVAAASLVLDPRPGAALSLGLLGVLTAVLVRTLRAGRPVACHCFGSWSRSPVSSLTVARNLGLALLAVLAGLGSPGVDHRTALTGAGPVIVALAVSLLVTVAVLVELARLRVTAGRLWSVDLGAGLNDDPVVGGARPAGRPAGG